MDFAVAAFRHRWLNFQFCWSRQMIFHLNWNFSSALWIQLNLKVVLRNKFLNFLHFIFHKEYYLWLNSSLEKALALQVQTTPLIFKVCSFSNLFLYIKFILNLFRKIWIIFMILYFCHSLTLPQCLKIRFHKFLS